MDTFDSLRPYLPDYLHHLGINPGRRFRCLNPEHPDRNPSMGYDPRRQKVHCFACGADYDLFDLLQIQENLSSPGEALALASALYGDGSADRQRTYQHTTAKAEKSFSNVNRSDLAASGLLEKETNQNDQVINNPNTASSHDSLSERSPDKISLQGSQRNSAEKEGNGAILSDRNESGMDDNVANSSRAVKNEGGKGQNAITQSEDITGVSDHAIDGMAQRETESQQFVENFGKKERSIGEFSTETVDSSVDLLDSGELQASGGVFTVDGEETGADGLQKSAEGGLNASEMGQEQLRGAEVSTGDEEEESYWQVEDLLTPERSEVHDELSGVAAAGSFQSVSDPEDLVKDSSNWQSTPDRTAHLAGSLSKDLKNQNEKSVSHETKTFGVSDVNILDTNTIDNGVNMDEMITFKGDLETSEKGQKQPSKTGDVANATDLRLVSGKDFQSEPGYLTDCARNRGSTDYFLRRGISDATAERFSLGYDLDSDCVVLPCAGGAFVRRSVSGKRYFNQKGRPAPLFQPELLDGDAPVFLVEGTFDALSAEELGYRACGMNGAGNREKIASLLRNRTGTAPVLLLPDADAAGEQWADALCGEFSFLWRCPRLPSGKDLNELLVSDRAGAARFLADCVEQQHAFRPTPYRELSAAGQLGNFSRYIESQASRPPLKTGWPLLDEALDGGLYDGLYVLGAVSSLGKTAFCMQLADQLAQQGRDVLIFSLEMTAYELMARSISRETFLRDDTRGRKLAKTVRGVLDGRRYPEYSEQEHLHLYNSEKRYGEYAGHLYFREGDHETGLSYLESEIRRHMEETGVKPVVLIDYLQIIAPVDVHFTDKQNLDRIVCGLKKLSRSEELTILAISSFNRENYNTAVSMTAFKESGGIDYSADVLLGLQPKGAGRQGFNVEEELRKDPRELELKIIKNRSAALGLTVPFRYYPAYSCFMEGKR